MDAAAPERTLRESGVETTVKQTPVGKFIVTTSPPVVTPRLAIRENAQAAAENSNSTTVNRTISFTPLKFVTIVPPMNQGVAGNKAVVAASPNSASPDGSPATRKFRYTSLNNLKRAALRPDISVTSTVATQTGPSFLRDRSPNKPPLASPNKTDLFAVCQWCGIHSKNFSTCDRCKRALHPDAKTYTPQTVRVSKPSPQTATPATIATLLPQTTTIILTPQNTTPALLATPVLKPGQFYGHQLSIQAPVTTRIIPQTPNGASKVILVGKQPQFRTYRGKKKAEPECLTISSDEEEVPANIFSPAPNELISSSNMRDGPPGSDVTDSAGNCSATGAPRKDSVDSTVPVPSPSWSSTPPSETGDKNIDEDIICIKCRSIRVGSYKVQAYEPQVLNVMVTTREFRINILCAEGKKMVDICIQKEDIPHVLAHFGKVLPVLFVYTTPACASMIRNRLGMTTKEKAFYDPCSSDECVKRITILPIVLTDTQKSFLSKIFPGSLLQEIKQTLANEVLIKSTPVQGNQHQGMFLHKETRAQAFAQAQKASKEVVKLVTYPPPPQMGGIEINSEDLECLNEGEFLNDVIIDFYLKYLFNEKLSPADRQQTHIFSSFFFPRLTTKTTEEEITITISRRRHARVKTWTRHVDIFEKDFIIVPINQNSHWFLAVICFPGMLPQDPGKTSAVKSNGCKTQDPVDGEECEPSLDSLEPMDTDDQESPIPPTPCPMAIPLPGIDEYDNASNSDPEPTAPSPSDRDPCILIFDSIAGNQRWKVVQLLREYLTIEYETRKKKTRIFDRNTMRGLNVTALPRQENYTDCGIFLLQYVESFFESPLKKFTVPLPHLDDWFPESKISGKRQELRELILSLQKQQQENSAANSSNKCGNQEKSA